MHHVLEYYTAWILKPRSYTFRNAIFYTIPSLSLSDLMRRWTEKSKKVFLVVMLVLPGVCTAWKWEKQENHPPKVYMQHRSVWMCVKMCSNNNITAALVTDTRRQADKIQVKPPSSALSFLLPPPPVYRVIIISIKQAYFLETFFFVLLEWWGWWYPLLLSASF